MEDKSEALVERLPTVQIPKTRCLLLGNFMAKGDMIDLKNLRPLAAEEKAHERGGNWLPPGGGSFFAPPMVGP